MKHITFSVCFALFSTLIFAQTPTEETSNAPDNSLKGQFQVLEKKSGNYRANGVRYEVIKVADLYQIKKNIFDSISIANTSIKDLTETIEGNNAEITNLSTKLKETTDNLNTITKEKDSISFFGALLSKGTYKAIMWAIVAGLLLLLMLFIYRFRNSNFLTQQAKAALADLEKEYEDHRRKALEREQKVSRRLQDELNKNKK